MLSADYSSGNFSGNNTEECHDGFCVESTLYRKIMGTVLFLLVWPFIVLDIKKLPLGRPAAALMGAVLMVIFAVMPQDQVYAILGEKGNLQTLFLLVGMMILSYYYDREGLLQYITLWIFGKNKPFKHVLWKVCVLSAVLSAIITNDAACLVLTPLLLAEHTKQGRQKCEYPALLLGIATSANIGSAATFFGNPQNAFIAANSRGQVSLLIFFITTLPAAIVGLAVSIVLLYLCYFQIIWQKRRTSEELNISDEVVVSHGGGGGGGGGGGDGDGRATRELCIGPPGNTMATYPTDSEDEEEELSAGSHRATLPNDGQRLAASREDLALSYDRSANPHHTSKISQERKKFYNERKENATTHSHNGRQLGLLPQHETSMSEKVPSGAESSSSVVAAEYGATKNCSYYSNDHIRNYISSGRVSRLQQHTRSGNNNNSGGSNRFGSSLEVSRTPFDGLNSTNRYDSPEGSSQSSSSSIDADESHNLMRRKLFVAWLLLVTIVLITLLAVPPPPVVSVEFNLGLIPVIAGVMSMFMDSVLNQKYAFDVMMKVDWTMILMFMGLFIWLGGFQNTLFPTQVFQFVRKYMDLYTIKGVLIFTTSVILGSNVLSNVPLVILIMDQLFDFECGPHNYCTGQLTGVLLAWVSTIAGNFTLIGSVANLIVAEKARNITGYRLGFWEYLKFGFFSTLLVLFIGLPLVYFPGNSVDI